MPLVSQIKPRSYHDSVRLMRVSESLSGLAEVNQAFVAMGTDANKRVLDEVGMLTDTIAAGGPNDLLMVIDAATETAGERALSEAESILAETSNKPNPGGALEAPPKSLGQGITAEPDANLMFISVPGPFAALEAAKALNAGLNVFLFSDNVSLADERALKELAVSKGLLVIGPGAGTAILNGVALGFANVVRRGDIGIVGASGTGLQELTTLIDWGGGGISQAIGTGGRDLSEEIDGLMMKQGIRMLTEDPSTSVITLISKPPSPRVTKDVLSLARSSGKPVVVNFLGDGKSGEEDGVMFTDTIEETAEASLAAMPTPMKACFLTSDNILEKQASGERAQLADGQRFVRGLYSGGTLCDETMEVLARTLPAIYSNIPLKPAWALADNWESKNNACIDLGEEEFTQGRPHPMIDFRLRNDRMVAEASDPEVGVILLDVVIGYGAHENPAGELIESIKEAKAVASEAGRYLSVVAHVCGTANDPQDLHSQEKILQDAGVITLPTNAQAAKVAAAIVSK